MMNKDNPESGEPALLFSTEPPSREEIEAKKNKKKPMTKKERFRIWLRYNRHKFIAAAGLLVLFSTVALVSALLATAKRPSETFNPSIVVLGFEEDGGYQNNLQIINSINNAYPDKIDMSAYIYEGNQVRQFVSDYNVFPDDLPVMIFLQWNGAEAARLHGAQTEESVMAVINENGWLD